MAKIKTKTGLLICLCAVCLGACGKSNDVPEEYEEEETQRKEENEESESHGKQENFFERYRKKIEEAGRDEEQEENGVGGDSDNIEEYKEAYLAYLKEFENAGTYTYSLIYVDEDDIPELVIDSGYEAGGCIVLTFHDGVLDEWQSSRLNFTYIEGGNLLCNSDGNMGYYYDSVYTIRDGKWCYVDGGTWGDGPDGPQFDENDEFIFVYHWGEGEEEVSEEEYQNRLNEVYPLDQRKYPERYYILKDIRSVLETGEVSSADHRYELIVEDVTWKEAESLCREKGGYLATVTAWEEMERIQEQIVSEDKSQVTFFVGANNGRDSGSFGYRWIEPESGETYEMLNLYNALFVFWLEGEPSYTGLTEDGVEVDEDYVVLFYRKSDDRCYLNDVPNDILSAASFYSGRVGYICEYEE